MRDGAFATERREAERSEVTAARHWVKVFPDDGPPFAGMTDGGGCGQGDASKRRKGCPEDSTHHHQSSPGCLKILMGEETSSAIPIAVNDTLSGSIEDANASDDQDFDSEVSEDLSDYYDDVYGLGFQSLPLGDLDSHHVHPDGTSALERAEAHCISVRGTDCCHQQLSEASASNVTTSPQPYAPHSSHKNMGFAAVVRTPTVATYDEQYIISWLSNANLSEFANHFIRAQVSSRAMQ